MTTSAPAPAPSPPRATATPFITSADQAGAFAFVREYYKRLDEAYGLFGVERGVLVMLPASPFW